MKKMDLLKKFTAVALALVIGAATCACGGAKAPADTATNTEVSENKEDTIEETATEAPTEEPTEAPTEEPTPTPVKEDLSAEAIAFARDMRIGWNLGNTLDAYIDSQSSLGTTASETCWGNPKTSQELIDTMKEAGFNTIRVPVSWHNHVTLTTDDNGEEHLVIDDVWVNRVKEVVDYVYNDDMYVIINIHHDNIPVGKFGYIPDYENEEQAMWYITEIWTRVAEEFKDYGEKLIFEGMNEPRLTNDPTHEWWIETSNKHCSEAIDVVNKLNQRFVDIVRASGSNNANRYLMVPGYCASVSGMVNKGFELPYDPASNKLMVAVHAYSPYDFALNEDMSLNKFDPESHDSVKDIEFMTTRATELYISQGIPVVLGEFGAREKNGNLSDRVAYYKYYVTKCKEAGIPCIVWDNGTKDGDGERFGLINRRTMEFYYPEIIDAYTSSWTSEDNENMAAE